MLDPTCLRLLEEMGKLIATQGKLINLMTYMIKDLPAGMPSRLKSLDTRSLELAQEVIAFLKEHGIKVEDADHSQIH